MFSRASMSILVKSRAKYGRRLTEKDYNELLNCSSIPEITLYLKNNTHYSSGLEGIKEAAVHRGNLEALLRKKLFTDFSELCRFEKSIGQHYFEHLLLKGDAQELLNYLRYFNAGIPEQYLFALPGFFNDHTHLDLIALAQCKTFDEIIKVLSKTPYAALLAPFKIDDKTVDFTLFEAVLDRYEANETQKLVRRYFHGDTAKELSKLFAIRNEMDNIRRIYRAKEYYPDSIDTIQSQLIDRHVYIHKYQLEKILECKNGEEVLNELKNTKYKLLLEKLPYQFIDDLVMRIMFDYCRRRVSFSTSPAVVMASTVILFETEIENLTNIIEAKRYGVASENIKPLLI